MDTIWLCSFASELRHTIYGAFDDYNTVTAFVNLEMKKNGMWSTTRLHVVSSVEGEQVLQILDNDNFEVGRVWESKVLTAREVLDGTIKTIE